MVKQALDRESMQALIKQDAIDRGGDRTTKKPGAVAMGFSQGSLKVVYDAEPEEPMCIVSFVNRFYYCTAMDRSRSYIYVREGALEMNHSYKRAICCYVCPDGVGEDYLTLQYFDRQPFVKATGDEGCGPCCRVTGAPRIELVRYGCIWCGMKIDPCIGPKAGVALVPGDHICYCCPLHVTDCDQKMCCYGFCGPTAMLGNPKFFIPFPLEPKDPATFVSVVQEVMERTRPPMPKFFSKAGLKAAKEDAQKWAMEKAEEITPVQEQFSTQDVAALREAVANAEAKAAAAIAAQQQAEANAKLAEARADEAAKASKGFSLGINLGPSQPVKEAAPPPKAEAPAKTSAAHAAHTAPTSPEPTETSWLAQASNRLSRLSLSLQGRSESDPPLVALAEQAEPEPKPAAPAPPQAAPVPKPAATAPKPTAAPAPKPAAPEPKPVAQAPPKPAAPEPKPTAPKPKPTAQTPPPPPPPPPKPAGPALPAGWREFKAPDGRSYYQKPDGTTTWALPKTDVSA